MRKIILCLSAMTLAMTLYSQKPIENRGSFRYVILPKHPIEDTNAKFKVEVESAIDVLSDDEKMKSTNPEKLNESMKLDTAIKYMDILSVLQNSTNANHTVRIIVPKPTVKYVTPSISDIKLTDTVFTYQCDAKVEIIKNDGSIKILDMPIYGESLQGRTKADMFFDPVFKLFIMMHRKPESQKDYIVRVIDREVYFNTIKRARYVVSEECLPVVNTLAVIVFSAKGKENYDDLTNTAETLVKAINSTTTFRSKNAISVDSVKALFTKAVVVWEKELALENKIDEKSRINLNIANVLRYNLSLGYLWLGDIKKANEYIKLVPESEVLNGKFVTKYSFTDCAQELRKAISLFESEGARAKIVDTTNK
jgi:hypothetical protein